MARQTMVITLALAALMPVATDATVAHASTGAMGAGESRVQANGISINDTSEGPVGAESILLIMGVAGQLTDWPPELRAQLLSRGYRVITFDNRDAGNPARPPVARPEVMVRVLVSAAERAHPARQAPSPR